MFLPPTLLLPTTADCVPGPAATTVSFVPDEADSMRTIPTVTVKNTPKCPQKQKNIFYFFRGGGILSSLISFELSSFKESSESIPRPLSSLSGSKQAFKTSCSDKCFSDVIFVVAVFSLKFN